MSQTPLGSQTPLEWLDENTSNLLAAGERYYSWTETIWDRSLLSSHDWTPKRGPWPPKPPRRGMTLLGRQRGGGGQP